MTHCRKSWPGAAAVLALLLTAGPGEAKGLGLRVGQPRLVNPRTVIVPVDLRAGRADEVAALNFTLHYDPARLAVMPGTVVAGRAVTRARAELASAVDEGMGTVKVLVVPEFSPRFGVLHGKRVATVTFELRGAVPKHPARWLRHRLVLDHVVLGDRLGRELRTTATVRKGK